MNSSSMLYVERILIGQSFFHRYYGYHYYSNIGVSLQPSAFWHC